MVPVTGCTNSEWNDTGLPIYSRDVVWYIVTQEKRGSRREGLEAGTTVPFRVIEVLVYVVIFLRGFPGFGLHQVHVYLPWKVISMCWVIRQSNKQ